MNVAANSLNEEQVTAYLLENPHFLTKHTELLESLTPPKRDLGGSVIDFQQFMVKNLQATSKNLQGKYDLLVEFCRDNLSSQSQVHHAVLRLIRARTLEQLLEAVTVDLVSLFDVDVVRLSVESEAAEFYDTYYSEENYSGIVFIPEGIVDAAIGEGRRVALIEDAREEAPVGFENIFADCAGLVRSTALLRLDLHQAKRASLLAFGVRHAGRFHPGQGIELLHFLAQIVAHQLDGHLSDVAP